MKFKKLFYKLVNSKKHKQVKARIIFKFFKLNQKQFIGVWYFIPDKKKNCFCGIKKKKNNKYMKF